MKTQNLKNEQGRSMVEMLGVLAVIGVLTIIGIAGFRVALNKHYANQTVERLMRRAVVVAGQANFGQNLSLHEFDENDGEYPISPILEKNSESFTLTVNEVPQEVCQQIVGLEWKLAKIIPADCSDTTMKFMFLNDLTDCTDCQPETFPCEDYGTECGKCSVVKGFSPNEGNQCADDEKPYCVRGRCEVCPAGQVDNDGNCKACSEINELQISIDTCHKCMDDHGKPTHFIRTSGGYCYKCTAKEYSTYNTTSLEECNRCANRCLRKDNNLCGEPGVNYPQNNVSFVGYALDPEGKGYCKCADGYYLSRDRNLSAPELCRTCEQIDVMYTSANDCHQCKNSQNKPSHFMNNIGACYRCTNDDWSGAYSATLEECNRCANRCLRRDNERCGEPGRSYENGISFVGYTLDTENNSGYCVCAEGYTMNAQNQCVAAQ